MCVGRGIDTDQHKANPAAVVLFRNLVVPDTNHLIARVLATGQGLGGCQAHSLTVHHEPRPISRDVDTTLGKRFGRGECVFCRRV